MSAKDFWAGHSIKGKKPQHPDVKRGGRPHKAPAGNPSAVEEPQVVPSRPSGPPTAGYDFTVPPYIPSSP